MRRFTLSFLTVASLIFVIQLLSAPDFSIAATWYHTDWHYRKSLTIDNTKVSGANDLNDFSILINRTDADLKSVANGGKVEQADGGDVLFTSADGLTKLAHEIEKYDPVTGELVAWVKVPTLATATDTTLYVYYGNATGVPDQSNKGGVWGTEYAAVWHLSENPASPAPQISDSARGNSGTTNGSMTSSQQVTGKINGSLNLDGSNDYIGVGNPVSLQVSGLGISYGAWVNVKAWNTVGGVYPAILSKVNTSYPYGGFQLNLENDASGRRIACALANGATWRVLQKMGPVTNTWYHVYCVYDGANLRMYINGVQEASTPHSGTIRNVAANLGLGRNMAFSANAYFNGYIDEARVLNVARSADWLATEYENQNNPATFASFGAEESSGPPPAAVTLAETSGTTSVTEGGATDTYTLVLASAPANSVTITSASANTDTGVTVSPISATFTATNWSVPQTMTVTAVDDTLDEGPMQVAISHAVTSADPAYSGIAVPNVLAAIVDNDDASAPIITTISSSNSGTSATITWTTSEPASSRVTYGATDAYGLQTAESDLAPRVTSHSVTIPDLSRCSTYHFQVTSADVGGNTTTSADANLFTTGCEVLYPELHPSCDDTNPNNEIRVRNDVDVAAVRNAVIANIWSGGGLPTGQPTSVTQNIGSNPYLTTTNMPNLARMDQIDVNLDSGFNSRMYHLIPTNGNNRLVIFHQGHGDEGLNPNGGKETIEYLIAHGFSVLAVQMPETGPNDGPADRNDHNSMQSLESPTFNPMEIFLEPIAVALNYMELSYSYQDISMTGISGGGWTTVLYAAIDSRIKTSFPVAGSYPYYLRYAPCATTPYDLGDYEQGSSGKPAALYANIASYLDLYILGSAGSDRQQVAIYNKQDPCCFGGLRYKIFEKTVADEVASLAGGIFGVALDVDNPIHSISSWAMQNAILPVLKSSVSLSTDTITATERAGTSSYSVVLGSKPISTVTITPTSGNTATGVTVAPSTLTFTAANWSVSQTVTVTAVDDNVEEGAHTATISHALTSSDLLFSGVPVANVLVQISDAPVVPVDVVWFDDALPAGAVTTAIGGEGWSWVSAAPAPYGGTLSHQSDLVAGYHQHFFFNATAGLSVASGDRLFTYVYLDPANPPSEILLQWYNGSWAHRAYWGANQIGWGESGTASRYYMGQTPPAGLWVRLQVPASFVGLEGQTLSGMSFVLYNGRATWDRSGKIGL